VSCNSDLSVKDSRSDLFRSSLHTVLHTKTKTNKEKKILFECITFFESIYMFAWTGLQVAVASLGWLVIHQLVESNIQKLNVLGRIHVQKKKGKFALVCSCSLQNQNFLSSCCCFPEDGKQMY